MKSERWTAATLPPSGRVGQLNVYNKILPFILSSPPAIVKQDPSPVISLLWLRGICYIWRTLAKRTTRESGKSGRRNFILRVCAARAEVSCMPKKTPEEFEYLSNNPDVVPDPD